MRKKSAVCTLFEGNYHFGLAALANSLYQHGFRGTIWAGYRGDLPFWANPLQDNQTYQSFEVGEGCAIHFLKLTTNYHLTNYKPDFLLELWDQYAADIDGICYFDPDIVVKREWSFFESWIENHVGLCEDINSPQNATCPKRITWQKVLQKYGVDLPSNLDQYVNGGFVGLTKQHRHFVETWKQVMEIIGQETEPLDISSLPSTEGKQTKRLPSALFYATDQDALNCALMLHEEIGSIADRDAMDFDRFGSIMSHAVGSSKPWNTQYLAQALDGRRVGNSHKLFWQSVQQPIRVYSDAKVRQQQFWIKLASFITNFYSRS